MPGGAGISVHRLSILAKDWRLISGFALMKAKAKMSAPTNGISNSPARQRVEAARLNREAVVQRKPFTAPVRAVKSGFANRTQPVPKVLQRKRAEPPVIASSNNRAHSVSNALRPRAGVTQAPVNCAVAAHHNPRLGSTPLRQAKTNVGQRHSKREIISPLRAPSNQLPRRSPTLQLFSTGVVQAVKFYPNLHPGAVEPVDPTNIFKLESFANQYRLHKTNSHGVNVPNQQYNFVRTREGQMLLHARYRHPSIAQGKQVLYAGEIFFNNGQLEWWSNGSGHYQPYVEDAEQAALPMNQFFSYQQVIKGEHKRKKV